MAERFGEAYIVKGAGIVAKGFYEELERCRLHPRYRALREPRAACARCWILWDKAGGGNPKTGPRRRLRMNFVREVWFRIYAEWDTILFRWNTWRSGR